MSCLAGTRNLCDNISDLKAQVAANNQGIGLVQALIQEYGLSVVQSYMRYIQVPGCLLLTEPRFLIRGMVTHQSCF